jgi:Listeria/Bacterioides repeat
MKKLFRTLLVLTVLLIASSYIVNAQYTVTVVCNGPGTTTPSGTTSGIVSGTQLTISVTPATGSGYSFVNWTASGITLTSTQSTSNPVTITVTSNITIYANLALFYNLNLIASPSSQYGYFNPGGGSFPAGQIVSVKAVPLPGYKFTNWSGDATGTVDTIKVTMNGNKNITGTFAALPVHNFTTTVTTPGTGTVSASSGPYYEGKQVTVTATPATGYIFTGWSNGASGTNNPITINMPTSDVTVTATFSPIPNMWKTSSSSVYYNTGNLGIGLTNPTTILQIAKTDVSTNLSLSNTAALDIWNMSGSANTGGQINFRSDANPGVAGIGAVIGYSNQTSIASGGSSGDLIFGVKKWRQDVNIVPAMTIKEGGNVIIGNTTQTSTGVKYKLDVYGLMRANDITVNTDGADFVFEDGYKLRSLTELETYIKANKHLPEIATAADMQSNGMTLGEVQTRLLQKIEELTLYLIEKDKQLKEQQSVISELKATVNELKRK